MPEKNGLKFYKTPQQENLISDIPFLMVSTENEKLRVIEALRSGIKDYMVKPIDVDLLEKNIETLLIKS
jgi:two-component system chemotaxis response regulator CheY